MCGTSSHPGFAQGGGRKGRRRGRKRRGETEFLNSILSVSVQIQYMVKDKQGRFFNLSLFWDVNNIILICYTVSIRQPTWFVHECPLDFSHFAIDFRLRTKGIWTLVYKSPAILLLRTNYTDTPSFTLHLLPMGVLWDEEQMKGNTGSLCLYPHTRPSISSMKRGKTCHPSRRDEIKDVLLNQLMITHLHRRACNLYPSNWLLLGSLWRMAFKLIFSKPQTMEGALEWAGRTCCWV